MIASKYKHFIFEDYSLNSDNSSVSLDYSYDNELKFSEKLTWSLDFLTDKKISINQSLQLMHLILGISYFKAYLAPNIDVKSSEIDQYQANFLNNLYMNGLGEFLYVNNLEFGDLAKFEGVESLSAQLPEASNADRKVLVPISGGKDSLLTAEILSTADIDFTPIYITTDGNYPKVLDSFRNKPIIVRRQIAPELIEANQSGALNGHVPFSAIIDSILIFTAQMYDFTDVVLSHESSANEATTIYKGQQINHQYSKTDEFDRQLQAYVNKYIDLNLKIFSLLSGLSELEINRLFVEKGIFAKYSGQWSSCNIANYKQGHNTDQLTWCGNCSKCANAFLLLAPFVDKSQLLDMFDGKNLLADSDLNPIFSSLLGESEAKPFECVAEINELRYAVQMLKDSGDWPEADKFNLTPHKTTKNHPSSSLQDPYQNALNRYIEA